MIPSRILSASGMRTSGTLAILLGMVGTPLAQTQISAKGRPSETPQRARIAFSHALPKLDGEHLRAILVEVSYGPGESSPPHSHPCAVIGYVLQGALRTEVSLLDLSHLGLRRDFYWQ